MRKQSAPKKEMPVLFFSLSKSTTIEDLTLMIPKGFKIQHRPNKDGSKWK